MIWALIYFIGFFLTLFILRAFWSHVNSDDNTMDYVLSVLWPVTLFVGIVLSIVIPLCRLTVKAAKRVRGTDEHAV